MTLQELIEALLEADPNHFQNHFGNYVGLIDGNWGIIPLDEKKQDVLTFAVIEVMLRQSIEAREWTWKITSEGYDDEGKDKAAEVRVFTPNETEDVWTCTSNQIETHPIPAIALGMAYLLALEVAA